MKIEQKNIENWEHLLDFLDMCDSDDIMIYAKLPNMNVPVDNFELMKIASSKNPEDLTYMCIEEDDGVVYLKSV